MASSSDCSRTSGDNNWSTKEQLCLASTVLKSANKDWTSVGKCLKEVCGQNAVRPLEWYSGRNCALQYRNLLDSCDSTKRKKRLSETMDLVVVDPATNVVIKRLTDERIEELKAQLRKEHEEYLQMMSDCKALESEQVTEEQLLQMWKELDKKEYEEMLPTRKKEEQKSDTTTVDMDVDETLSSTKASIQIPSQVSGTSPLLSSLLKSPTAAIPPQSIGANSARVTAPTITTLLTSGSIPNSNQPTITLKSHIPPEEAVHLLTRPISGPPNERLSAGHVNNKTVLSPSQTAPTLSMLLEKSKNQQAVTSAAICASIKETKQNDKTDNHQTSQAVKKEDPVTCEASTTDTSKPKTPIAESEEADLNDEQQLLDVFGNIGDIAELVADVAAVINEQGVDDVMESIMKAKEDTDKHHIADPGEKKIGTSLDHPVDKKLENKDLEVLKVESSNSDDSNDDLPLATVACLTKEQSFEKKDKNAEDTKIQPIPCLVDESKDKDNVVTNEEEKSNSEELDDKMNNEEADMFAIPDDDSNESSKSKEDFKKSEDDKSGKHYPEEKQDYSHFSDKEDEDEKEKMDFDKSPHSPNESKSMLDSDDEGFTKDANRTTPKDELYDTFDKTEDTKTSIEDDQTMSHSTQESLTANAPVRPPVLRKLRERDRSESPLVDDDTTASDYSTSNMKPTQRCSLTPNMDSIPNSPVNSITSSEHEERRETRGTSKKSLLNVYNSLQPHKYIGIFQRIFEHESYQEVCNNPMDFILIKKNIELGSIKTLNELQRDVLLMCTNALMLSKVDSSNYKAILTFKIEVQNMKEFVVPAGNNEYKDHKLGSSATPPVANVSKRGRKKNYL